LSRVPDTFPNPDTLISELGIRSPGDIDVGAIAEFCGVDVELDGLDGSEASLVGFGDRAIITVKRLGDPIDRRFSIAHELGHWNLDRGTVHFDCDQEQPGKPFSLKGRWRLVNTWWETDRPYADDSLEPAANAWAADLLMPDRFFVPDVAGKPVTWDTILDLVEVYDTSILETARRLVAKSSYPCLLIRHGPGHGWAGRQERNPGLPPEIVPVIPGPKTVATELLAGSEEFPGPVEVPAVEWLIFPQGHNWMRVWEDSVSLVNGEVLTLLWFKEEMVMRFAATPEDPEVVAWETWELRERFRRSLREGGG